MIGFFNILLMFVAWNDTVGVDVRAKKGHSSCRFM